jgi:predicted metal-dependent hydrolase
MKTNQFFIREIGDISIRQSKRARYLSISIKPFKGVVVTVPFGVSYKSAARFVEEKREWILKNLEKIKSIEDKRLVFEESTLFQTKEHKLLIKQSDKENSSVRIVNKTIHVSYAKNADVRSEEIQSVIHGGIVRAYRKEAKDYLPGRVKELANKFDFKYEQLRLKNIKSRWGSCSKRNNINLSIHLMKLPYHLIDYVILHELVHTIHKNHGPKFWKLLQQVIGNARGLDKELRDFRIKEY